LTQDAPGFAPIRRKTRFWDFLCDYSQVKSSLTTGSPSPIGCQCCSAAGWFFVFKTPLAWQGKPWMMTPKTSLRLPWLTAAAFGMLLLATAYAHGQTTTEKAPPADSAQAAATEPAMPNPDRASAYFHVGLANIYESEAGETGNTEDARLAIEEYKSAINADPTSPQLNDGLADLYFRIGRMHEAESTARGLLKSSPDDVDAHKLLGRIYLRQLSDASNAVSSSSPSGNVLDLAIAEFEKIVSLQRRSVEDRMVLGQLYKVKHDSKKAEEQFNTAQAIEPESEEVVLNLASLYAESSDLDHAIKVIEAVPVTDRTPKMEFALGGIYDQLKRPKDAIAAYQRAADLDPSDVHTIDALGQALLSDNQFDEALKQFKVLADADPEDTSAQVHIGEILRRQGKYEDALAVIRKARKQDPKSLEAGFNEGLILDVLGRFDEATQTYEKMVEVTSHANGADTAEEKSNHAFFLERLGAICLEQNKTDQAIAAYQKLIDMGGDQATRGYELEVEAYGEAKQFDKATEVAKKAADSNPNDPDMKMMLAGALVEQGKSDEGIAMVKAMLDGTDKDRGVWMRLSQFDIQLHRWKDAEDALAKAEPLTTKKEDRTYLLFMRGELAERQKHYEPAEQYFRQVLDIDPANAMTLNYLGYMLADKGDKGIRLPEALKLIKKAVDLEPMNGAYLDSLGWVYFKLGQYEPAEENLRQAVQRDQTDPTVHDHLGDLYEKTGRIRLAAAQWEMSLAQYAKSATADVEATDVAKVQHKLETARVRLAKQDSAVGQPKPE
jgi:tetratricopeptide (TPR) repeat protein